MVTDNYEKEISFIESVLKEAAQRLNHMKIQSIHDKTSRDLVTSSDYAIEQYIITMIQSQFPSDHILSEEMNQDTLLQERTWVLDPIDGTCNYANAIPMFGIQLALTVGSVIAAAGIMLPCLNELYLASQNGGCTLNGKKLTVKPDSINHSIVSFGDFNEERQAASNLQSQTMKRLRYQIMKEKMFGAASVDFAYLASGKTSGTFLIASHAWDILPGILIALEAGAVISDEKGKPFCFDSEIVLAANSQELIELMRQPELSC